jgi:hypothetical protein
MVKIKKKLTKEDKLVSTTAKISMFINLHWKKITITAASIVVLLGFIALYSYYVYQDRKSVV